MSARVQEPVTGSVTPCKDIRLKLNTHQFWPLDEDADSALAQLETGIRE